MTHSPIYSDDLPNTSTRPGLTYQALSEANWRLQLFADSPGALDRRFDGPPPPYRSRSVTPVNEGPNEVIHDSPELLRRLEENARRLPYLWKKYEDKAFLALPQKEKQRLIEQRAALRKRMEERKRRQEAAIDRFFTTPPESEIPDGMSADPKNKQRPARTVSPNHNHPTRTETRKSKREIGNNIEFLAPSDPRKPGSQASKRARTRGANMQLNSDQHIESQDEPVKYGVRLGEKVPSAKAAAEPPSALSNSSPKLARKPRTARPATKAKPLTEILIRRSSRIAAMRSRKTESSKPITSSKRRKNRKSK